MDGDDVDRWGRKRVQQTGAPAPKRVDPGAAPAAAAGAGRYSADYSRFDLGDGSDDEEPPPPPEPSPLAPRPQRVVMADGTELLHVPDTMRVTADQLPEGAQSVTAAEVPGTPEFLHRAEQHFKQAEAKATRPATEKILRQMHAILEDRSSDKRFREFICKYFHSYKQDKETLHNFRPLFADDVIEWWGHKKASTAVVPVVVPEVLDWWYDDYPTHDFEKIADYFVQVGSYRKFVAQCKKQIEDWDGRRPEKAGGLSREVLEQYGLGSDHLKHLRAWALSQLMEVWLTQWGAGMQARRQGQSFAAGVEQHSVYARQQVKKPKGWCDPPPGSITYMLRTVVPALQTPEQRNRQ
eukprot:TRINITY_DN18416_c0_g1_i1.p1 TRINITY_DN18416_c0_g1~~TRINITY_DN18416_c0_g1_i1.p1  ORF type:complete len:370 (+),score=146.83 TRINITY_DN18416_c0_g1_i1:57-1112(+)